MYVLQINRYKKSITTKMKKGCACYGSNSIHKCYCHSNGKSNKSNISKSERVGEKTKHKAVKNINRTIC